MPKRIRAYLDTSVISALFDERDHVRQELTRDCFERHGLGEFIISQHVLDELGATRASDLRTHMLEFANSLEKLPWQAEIDQLVIAYIEAEAFTATLSADARHVAAAVVTGIPLLLSWNFRHLVNRGRRIRVNLVNSREGYGQVEILAPPELD